MKNRKKRKLKMQLHTTFILFLLETVSMPKWNDKLTYLHLISIIKNKCSIWYIPLTWLILLGTAMYVYVS